MHEGVQTIDAALIASVVERARRSPRGRMNHNLHRSDAENPNRFLNAMVEGTYVTPHRHLRVPKPELFVVIEGRVCVFTFDGTGAVTGRYIIGQGAPGGSVGIDMAPGVWHTLAVLTPHAVIVEVKPGNYDPATDKEFAPWAPREGDPAAGEYMKRLLRDVNFTSG